MTTIDLNLLDENDAFNAASVNTRLAAIRAGLLDIPEYAIEDHGLGPDHLPSLVIDITAVPGLSRYFSISPVYTASPPTYTTWGNHVDWAVVSDGSGGATVSSGDLSITHTLFTLGMNQGASRIGAMVVFANMSLTLPATNNTFVFCLQYKNSAGDWKTIKNTETIVAPGRMAIAATQRTVDVSINTILRITEIPVSFKGLRVAHSTKTGGSTYYINKGELTLIPLHCAVV